MQKAKLGGKQGLSESFAWAGPMLAAGLPAPRGGAVLTRGEGPDERLLTAQGSPWRQALKDSHERREAIDSPERRVARDGPERPVKSDSYERPVTRDQSPETANEKHESSVIRGQQ